MLWVSNPTSSPLYYILLIFEVFHVRTSLIINICYYEAFVVLVIAVNLREGCRGYEGDHRGLLIGKRELMSLLIKICGSQIGVSACLCASRDFLLLVCKRRYV